MLGVELFVGSLSAWLEFDVLVRQTCCNISASGHHGHSVTWDPCGPTSCALKVGTADPARQAYKTNIAWRRRQCSRIIPICMKLCALSGLIFQTESCNPPSTTSPITIVQLLNSASRPCMWMNLWMSCSSLCLSWHGHPIVQTTTQVDWPRSCTIAVMIPSGTQIVRSINRTIVWHSRFGSGRFWNGT